MTQSAPPADAGEERLRPVVRTGRPGRIGVAAFILALLLGGYLVFTFLNDRRTQVTAPDTVRPASSAARIAAPPPLTYPSFLDPPVPLPEARVEMAPPQLPPALQPYRERIVTRVVEVPASPVRPADDTDAQPKAPAIVFDREVAAALPAALAAESEERVLATRLANPSLTVPRGSVVPAVLETALDTTQPGFARALVQRDVHGFDGSRVLIPRGSRVYGEYGSDLNYGENRALIRWTRLIRPDGVVMNLDSPSADPLGRAGIKGKVNTHFFARFGSAILQSVLDVGVGLATRSVSDDTVILALPGSRVPEIVPQQQGQVRPTLTVRQGTSVSVFVARDLDFSSVER